MINLKFEEIVLLRFSFADGKTFKKRPALLINSFGDGDIVVYRITSKIYEINYDIYIENWKNAGLMLPSIIGVHKLATLEKSMVLLVISEIDTFLKSQVKSKFLALITSINVLLINKSYYKYSFTTFRPN